MVLIQEEVINLLGQEAGHAQEISVLTEEADGWAVGV
ncbi:hypothetical protein SCAZ3_04235 [Streptococcus canis FSL Z3-227]|uniref:Uncharacterized protein n=1 Tax=Streptococcus canis FSL Z3-227 TaxID=482234 RepID=A0AAV3FR54_STRCB|nr:hypothetical protein SCAZ3_04235 [Streptococcus canis FSL Z3-227]